MTFHRPGLYVSESLLATTTPVNTSVSVAAFVGAAPRGPIVPTLLRSWTDAQRAFGKFTGVAAADVLLQAIYNAFTAGARDTYACRAVADDAAPATLPFGISGGSTNEVQLVTISGAPTGGTFTLTLGPDTTAGIAPNATAAAVRNALTALPGIGAGNVTVTGSGGGPYTITFTGALAGTDVAQITADASGLTGGNNPSVAATTSTGGAHGAYAIDFSAISPGLWGNRLFVEVLAGSTSDRFSLNIREVPVGITTLTAQQIVERWSDLSLDPSDPRYVLSVLNSAISPSAFITAALHAGYVFSSGDVLAPSNVTGGSKLAGGLDGAAVDSADLLDAVYQLDVVSQPFVLNLPGVTDTDTITALADYADASRTRQDNGQDGRGDVFVVVDTDPGDDADTAITQVQTYPQSDYLAAYYPPVIVPDPSSTNPGATKTVAAGPLVVGRYIATDAARGVFKSPAGVSDGLLAQVVALDPAATLLNPQLDRLNDAGVNAIKLVPNTGFCIFGARTLKSSFITRYVAPRRTIITVRAELLDATAFAVFENNDSFLWGLLYNDADKICRDLYAAGGLKGGTVEDAYYVLCDETNNTEATIEQGEVHLEVGLALQRPAEFVVIQIAQYQGGSSASDSNG